MVQIDLGERLIRLADKVLSKNSNETIGHTGGITNATANDTYIPTTKAVKEYVDEHEHQHGNIQNNGSIGSTANKPIITTTNGVLTTGSFGTSANTFCQGNDSRLSNDRNPISHAVNDTRYGAASSTNYGHIRVMDNLTSTGTTDALSANQGKELKTLVDTKIPITDIKDNLTSSDTNKPLSANQGKELKTLVDTKVPITDIKNNLTSTDTNKPLSAKQGQVLKSLVDSKANQNHTHPNISDTGWQNVVFESKFRNYASNTNNVRYRRIGKIVHIEGIFTNTSTIDVGETAIKVATIPEIYCRPEYIQYGLMQGSGANKFLLSIHPNGNIGIARYGTTSATTTQVTYNSSTNIGAWLQCYLTWMVETENISYPTTIISDHSDAYPNGYTLNIGDPISLAYKLEANGEGIANQTIKLYIDNVEKGTRITNNNGYVLFENILPWATFIDTNTHNIRVQFEDNAPYRSCIYTSSVGGSSSGGGDPIIAG